MSETKHPELHVNEQPSNDFLDTAKGFGFMLGILLLIAVIFCAASLLMGDANSAVEAVKK